MPDKYNPSKKITFFSDSVVISFEYDDADLIFTTISIIQILLVNLLSKGIVMRGGISMGKLIHTKEYLFGPAFIDAYDIESKKAIYPRIICDESIILLSQSGKPLQSALQDLIIFIEIIRQDTDNYWYIDYIENVQSLFDTYEEEIDYLNEIGKFTEKCLLENPKGKVNKKYKWLRNKYNETLKRKLKNKELKLKNPDLYSIIKSLKLIK